MTDQRPPGEDSLSLRRGLLDDAVRQCRGAARAAGGAEPASLARLVRALRTRYTALGRQSDLAEAVSAADLALSATAAGEPGLRAQLLTEQAELLRLRYHADGIVGDLDTAIALLSEAMHLTVDPVLSLPRLLGLARAHLDRFHHLRDPADVDRAAEAFRLALATVPDDQIDVAISGLVAALIARYSDRCELADLDEGIALLEPVAARDRRRWAPAPQQVEQLAVLARLLRMRFDHAGSRHDLSRAIVILEQVATHRHPSRAAHLSQLADAWRAEFALSGDPDSLRHAIESARAALEATGDRRPDFAARALTLAQLHLMSVQTLEPQGTADVDAAVQVCRRLLRSIPHDVAEHAECLHVLGVALRERHRLVGDVGDLTEACSSFESACTATAPGTALQRRYMSSLAESLRARAASTGSSGDLDRARHYLWIALQSTPADDPEHARRSLNLAEVLLEQTAHEPAVIAFRNSVLGFTRCLGAEDSQTLQARIGYGRALSGGGHQEEALAELSGVVRALMRRYCGDHPGDLAASGTGGSGEALRLLSGALAARSEILGPDHPDALAASLAINALT